MGNCCGGGKNNGPIVPAPVADLVDKALDVVIPDPKPTSPPKKPPRDVEAPPPPIELLDDDPDGPATGPADPTGGKKDNSKKLRPIPIITKPPVLRRPTIEVPSSSRPLAPINLAGIKQAAAASGKKNTSGSSSSSTAPLGEKEKRFFSNLRSHPKPLVYDPYGDSAGSTPTKTSSAPGSSIFSGAKPASAPMAPIAQTVDFDVLTPPLPMNFIGQSNVVSNVNKGSNWAPMAGSVGLTTRPLSQFKAIVTMIPSQAALQAFQAVNKRSSTSKSGGGRSSSSRRRGSKSSRRHSRSGSVTLAIPQGTKLRAIRKRSVSSSSSPFAVQSTSAVSSVTTLIGDTSAVVASTPGLTTYTTQNSVIGAEQDWEDVAFSPFSTSEASLTAGHLAARGETSRVAAKKKGFLDNGVPENYVLEGLSMVRKDARVAAATYKAPKSAQMILRQVKSSAYGDPSTKAKARSVAARSPAIHVTSAIKLVDDDGLMVVSGPEATPAKAQGPGAIAVLPKKMEEIEVAAVSSGAVLKAIGDSSTSNSAAGRLSAGSKYKGKGTGLRKVESTSRNVLVRAGSTVGKARAAKAKAKAPGTSLVAARRRSLTKSKAPMAAEAKPAGGQRVKTATTGGYIAVMKAASSPKSPSSSSSKSSKTKDGAYKVGTYRAGRIASPVIRLG